MTILKEKKSGVKLFFLPGFLQENSPGRRKTSFAILLGKFRTETDKNWQKRDFTNLTFFFLQFEEAHV